MEAKKSADNQQQVPIDCNDPQKILSSKAKSINHGEKGINTTEKGGTWCQ